ncbi:integrase arm-type DNA-binding domain-containing protein [Vibrio cholerae]|nr:integrase arm-type DNA-binding domain-containing protein [Vibrio cholerae]ELJ8691236.1 integrase arm-type DNA-binding domain-containing protein [Vibrio cholerae]
MGKLTAKQVIAYSKADPKKYSDGEGLYFCVRKQGSPYWMIRYTTAKGRREATLGQFPLMSLADARIAAAYFRKEVRDGIDPLLEKQKIELPDIETVDQLFHDWYRTDLSRRLKHPKIPYRVYTKDISPVIGIKCIAEVTARDVREVLERIRESNRPTIANDTLMYMKQLFRHAIKLDLTLNNPAAAFTVDDAGGVESSKDRMLSKEEIHYAFSVFHTHINSFGRDNYLACCLFLVLGVRKSELCEAMWREMDLTTGVWDLPKERSKTGVPISIPLPRQAIAWFNELQIRACGSPYVFPARRASHRPHMGPDTLNRAISKLFGREPGRKKQPPNKMGKLEHFTVHDLRRTFRSLAASLGIAGNVAERCLNHKLKGVEGIYDRHDYFEERRIAHQTVADVVEPLVNFEPASQHQTGGH